MKVTMKLPRIGMNMEEATLVKWHKQPGESFKTGDVLYEIETEKVSQEFAATADGTMLEQCVAEGANVPVGERVCVVDVSGPSKP
jgi:pyruvate/2-oxoglutarate dehydrogenase complex dihydrolipoamide acyltransferase (E2) component